MIEKSFVFGLRVISYNGVLLRHTMSLGQSNLAVSHHHPYDWSYAYSNGKFSATYGNKTEQLPYFLGNSVKLPT